MTISAKQVMDLRAATGMPMMKCKKALEAEGGDFEKAIDRLRKEGLKSAEKRAARATGEGLVRVHVSDDHKRATMIAVACETEPVARTDDFQTFVTRLMDHVQANPAGDADALLAQAWIDDPTQTVDEVLRGLIAKIGENMRVQAVEHVAVEGHGLVGAYVHFNEKIGAMVAIESAKENDKLAEIAKDLCMHIVFQKPAALVRSEIPQADADRELEIYRAQMREDPKMAKKPADVIDKIVEGKLGAYYKERVLTEQAWIRDDKLSVEQVLQQHGARVTAFTLLQVGG